MPWLYHQKEYWFNSPSAGYSLSVYAKFRENGQPMLTIYYNVMEEWVEDIKVAWYQSVVRPRQNSGPRLLDHWMVFSKSISRLQESGRFYDAMLSLYVSRFSDSFRTRRLMEVITGGERLSCPSWFTTATKYSRPCSSLPRAI